MDVSLSGLPLSADHDHASATRIDLGKGAFVQSQHWCTAGIEATRPVASIVLESTIRRASRLERCGKSQSINEDPVKPVLRNELSKLSPSWTSENGRQILAV